MKAERFRVVASANSYERLPSGDAPSFEVLDPPANFYARYEGKVLDTLQLQEAQDNIVASGYMFDADQRAWVKAPLKRSAVDFLPHDDYLRFVARVLASDAPKADREDAAQMVRDIRRSIYDALAAQPTPESQAEPVGYVYSDKGIKHGAIDDQSLSPGDCLYDAPSAVPVPLTEDRIAEISLYFALPHSTVSFVRAIEQAHGITAQGEKP